ncbi:MAG: MATE family efflux transporter [Pseudomonadota bacterium]
MAQRPAKFLEGDLMRHVVVMSLSASIGLVSIFLVDFVDLFFIAMLGQQELAAAVGFAGTLLFFTFSVTIGMMIAISAISAQLIGRGEDAEARRMATSAVVFGIAMSAVVALAVWLYARELVAWLGATGDTQTFAVNYLRIVVPSMPVATFGMMCSGLLRAHGDARRAMTVTLAAGAVNAILDPIFIFGLGMGLEGAALASVCARFATAIVAVIPIIRHYGGFARFDFAHFPGHLKTILALATPAVLTNVATPIGNGIVTKVIAPFGDSAVAGYAVVGRLTPLAFCVIFALSGAVGPIIGQNFGARNYARVKGTLARAVAFATGYTLVAWLLLMALSGFVSDQFRLTGDARELVFWFAVAVAPLFVFNGALFISNAAFNNLKRPIWSTLLNWGKNTIGVAPFVIFGAQIGGAPGVLIGQAIGGVLFGVLGLWLAFRLVDAYDSGDTDPDGPWRPPLMRGRPDAPFSSPRA